jgi:hypothetical protein
MHTLGSRPSAHICNHGEEQAMTTAAQEGTEDSLNVRLRRSAPSPDECCDVPVGRQVQHKKRNSLGGYKNPADIPIAAISGSAARGVHSTPNLLQHRVTVE